MKKDTEPQPAVGFGSVLFGVLGHSETNSVHKFIFHHFYFHLLWNLIRDRLGLMCKKGSLFS